MRNARFERALAIREKTLGSEHPDVAKALDYLALLYRKTGRAEDASKLEERAKEIKSRSGNR
jgi:tetratricopeptide (TPR) repeat protein